MHSSLVQQMDNFQTTKSSVVLKLFHCFEKKVLCDASSVIVICRTLFDHAAEICGLEKLTLIENFVDDCSGTASLVSSPEFPNGSDGDRIVLYAGTLEAYQGIPLLLESMALLPDTVKLWVAGGQKVQITAFQEKCNVLGVSNRVHFFGQLDPNQIPMLIRKADVLVSPRFRGTNIPLKVYSYLKSGKPLVATDILSHTQSLSDEIAILVKPEAGEFSKGILAALGEKGKAVSKAATAFCEVNYSNERYDELVSQALKKARRP